MVQFRHISAGLLVFTGLSILIVSANGQQAKDDGQKNKEAKVVVDKADPTRYVYLTHTDPEQQTAYLRNRFALQSDKKLVAKPKSEFNRFRITDKAGEKVYFQAKVTRVDLRVVYVQNEKTIYAWQIGTSLEDALRKGLSAIQLTDLKLEIDQDYAKEMAQTKKK